jgi:hypothetical protein
MAKAPTTNPVYIKQKRALAKAMGIGPSSLYELFKRKNCPVETPDGFHLGQMITFAKREMVTQMDKGGLSDAVSARLRLTIAQISKIELQNEKARGQYLDRDVWKQEFGGLVAELDASFSRAFLQELPLRLEGKSSVEIRESLKEYYNKIRTEFYEKGMAIKPKGAA